MQPGPEYCPFGAGVVHDGSDVVHRRFERLHLTDAIGETRAPAIEKQDSSVRGKALDVAYE